MISQKSSRFFVFKNLDSLKILVLLAITTWIAHFWHSASFGLYEDDLGRFAGAMGMTWSQVWGVLQNQGRPLHEGPIYLFLFLGFKLGGLHVVYLIGYIILTVNAFLFYGLLKRLSNQQVFVVTGALAFCLFPADTTQALPTHFLGLQPSLTLLLLAFHCYLSGRRKSSYLVILGTLLCYEAVFPMFLAAPLLKRKWDSTTIKELFKHALFLGLIIASVFLIRKFTGESRVSNLDIFSLIKSLRQMLYGPIVSMGTFLYRPIYLLLPNRDLATELKNNIGELLVFLPLCFVSFTWVLSQLKIDTSRKLLDLKTLVDGKLCRLEIPNGLKHFAKLSLIGLILLILSYPLALTLPPNLINGRGSRVHFPAVVGASILCACVCSTILLLGWTLGRKRLAAMGLAAFLTLLLGFGLLVQQDYKLAWQYQKAFWSDVVRLCPDVTDGTVIVVEPVGLHNPRQIMAHSWALPVVLEEIYQFPDDWKIPPRVYRLNPHWQNYIGSDGNLLHLKKTTEWLPFIQPQHKDLIVDSSNVILLDTNNGRMTRRTEPLSIGSQDFILKDILTSEPSLFEKGSLYDYLINPPDSEPISYLK